MVLANFIDEHKALVLSQVWPRLDANGLKIGDSKLNAEIEGIIGPSALVQLKTASNGIINFTDENGASLRDAFSKFRTTLKGIYPKHKFIDYKPLE